MTEAKREHLVSGEALLEVLAGRDEAARKAERERRRQDARQHRLEKILRDAKDEAQESRDERAGLAERAVVGYLDVACADAVDAFIYDEGAPRFVNYVERYEALRAMQDRTEMLLALADTLNLADRILKEAPDVDIQGAAERSAGLLRRSAARLGEPAVAKNTDAPPRFLSEEEERRVAVSADAALDEAFNALAAREGFAPADDFSALGREMRSALNKEAACFAFSEASRAEGARCDMSGLPVFCASLKPTMRYSVDKVRWLFDEVLQAYETFEAVVRMHGLFAAFACDNRAGKPGSTQTRGMRAFKLLRELELQGEGVEDEEEEAEPAIPTTIREKKHGDTVEDAIARMRQYNDLPYLGMPDEDFLPQVAAFWYGYRKLMEFVNGLWDADLSGYRVYMEEVCDYSMSQARALGARLSPGQLYQWIGDVLHIDDED
ncbi:MAG: hypothetical protein HFJ72_04975 [Adlercreutzia sp.]|nr:hypothetical protein [Adlercreutzia sp.]